MKDPTLKHILEAILLAAARPLTLDQLLAIFVEEECPERDELRSAIEELQADYADRGIEVSEVASGYRIQVRPEMQPWVSRLWEEKPSRYSRALLETLVLIAYRQPVTRGEIEDIRGVSVSTSIMKTLQDRKWVRVVGHRDVPGRPSMYGTTREFLDYFDLKSLNELPTLAELRDPDMSGELMKLDLEGVEEVMGETGDAGQDDATAVEDAEDSMQPVVNSGEDQPGTLH